jgi:hypothetical protein
MSSPSVQTVSANAQPSNGNSNSTHYVSAQTATRLPTRVQPSQPYVNDQQEFPNQLRPNTTQPASSQLSQVSPAQYTEPQYNRTQYTQAPLQQPNVPQSPELIPPSNSPGGMQIPPSNFDRSEQPVNPDSLRPNGQASPIDPGIPDDVFQRPRTDAAPPSMQLGDDPQAPNPLGDAQSGLDSPSDTDRMDNRPYEPNQIGEPDPIDEPAPNPFEEDLQTMQPNPLYDDSELPAPNEGFNGLLLNDGEKKRYTADCDRVRQRAMAGNIGAIDLDLSPEFGVGPRERERLDERKSQFVQSASIRPWYDYQGQFVIDGRLVNLARDQAILETASGSKQAILLADLSDADLAYVGESWGLPVTCTLGDQPLFQRNFIPSNVAWTASGLCHKPLYFEEVQLERYGHEIGPVVQPVVSTAHFFVNIAFLPYKMGIHPPQECQYALGYYRPGNCAPWTVGPIPISLRGALAEAGAIGILATPF